MTYKGINRAEWKHINESRREPISKSFSERKSLKCVFISHQKKDRQIAMSVAKAITDAGIDVYFDEDDSTLEQARLAGDKKGVTACILKGIERSSHLLAIITPQTRNSQWVPFEIGYAYKPCEIKALMANGLAGQTLPEYLDYSDTIISEEALADFIQSINGSYHKLEKSLLTERYHMYSNHLRGVF